MRKEENLTVHAPSPTRRELMVGAGMVFAGVALGSVSAARGQAMAEKQSTGADKKRTFLRQEVTFKASPQRIYQVLLDSKQFSAFSHQPAEIHSEVGGAFSMFGGRIVGRNIELVPNQRIVQAWRPASWEPGVYSIVKFEFTQQGPRTKVALDHTGFPEGDFGHLNDGWKTNYWDPLTKFLA